MMKKVMEQALQELEEGKYDEYLDEKIREYERLHQQRVLREMSQSISIHDMPGTEEWANIKVFEGEPYTPDTYVPEFLNDYLVGLEYLRQTFNRTQDMAIYNALMQLMPVGLYFAKYDDAN